MLSSKVHHGWSEIDDLEGDWNQILRSCASGVYGPDGTRSFMWAKALSQSILADRQITTVSTQSNGLVLGIMPTFGDATHGSPSFIRVRRDIAEAYSGRSCPLVRNSDPGTLRVLLNDFRRLAPPWDVLLVRTVDDSPSHKAMLDAIEGTELRCCVIQTNESPYIELGESWTHLLSTLPKKTRWTIRKAEKELSAIGSITHRHLEKPADADELIESIYTVERKSWKEASGTSITAHHEQTTLYRSLIELAASSGVLSGHVLTLDTKPIAYILGIQSGDHAFLDLKESFDSDYSKYSPGHVLKRFAIELLMTRGITTYDFMGACEPYKMRWTTKTYRTLTLALYNTTFRGRLAFLRAIAGRRLAGTTAKQ